MPDQPQRPAPRLKQPSHSGDRPSIEVDRTVGGATEQRRFDAPKRTTLTNLPAARLPAPQPTLSGLPAPPPLPGELAPTMKAPVNPLEKKTWRLPTPPSALANARRTDPPAAPEATPTSIRVPADEPAQSGRAESREAILQNELAKERALRAEAQRELRVQRESRAPGPYQEPITRSPAPRAELAPAVETIPPDGTIVSLRKAQTRLYLGLAAFLAVVAIPFAGWLTAIQSAAESRTKSERADVKANTATTVAEEARSKTNTNAKVSAATDTEFRQHRANEREIWRLLGVEVPKHEGDPEPENLEPMTPYCAPGKVCPGPQIVLRRAP